MQKQKPKEMENQTKIIQGLLGILYCKGLNNYIFLALRSVAGTLYEKKKGNLEPRITTVLTIIRRFRA